MFAVQRGSSRQVPGLQHSLVVYGVLACVRGGGGFLRTHSVASWRYIIRKSYRVYRLSCLTAY